MSGDWVDLRSDTVTKPGEAMRRAMASAEVGDDGYGEDPTTRRLEEAFAARLGKEAALFFCSGTMANQVAIRTLTVPGTVVVAGGHQHVVAYEAAAAARNSGVQFHLLDDSEGVLDVRRARYAIDAASHHQPKVSLVVAEDTHMAAGGVPWPDGALAELADGVGDVPLHLDGARLFNAEVATGTSAEERAAAATTVMCCMSKGLGAPVGSLLAGPSDVIDEARVERFTLGGGMRQSGVVAAAGLVALGQVGRLAEDHRRARLLAEAVSTRWPEALPDPAVVRTNIVVWEHPSPDLLLAHLRDQRVLAGTIGPGLVRIVTHLDLDDDAVAVARRALATSPL